MCNNSNQQVICAQQAQMGILTSNRQLQEITLNIPSIQQQFQNETNFQRKILISSSLHAFNFQHLLSFYYSVLFAIVFAIIVVYFFKMLNIKLQTYLANHGK